MSKIGKIADGLMVIDRLISRVALARYIGLLA